MELKAVDSQVVTNRSRPRPRRAWLSLRFKFVLWVVSVVAYLCLALGFLFVYLTQANTRAELYERGAAMASAIARESGGLVSSGDHRALVALLRATVEDDAVLFASIRDSRGEVLASAGAVYEPPMPRPGRTADAGVRPRGEDARAEVMEIIEPIVTQVAPPGATVAPARRGQSVQVGTVRLQLSTVGEGAAGAVISRQLAPLMLVSCVLSILGTVLVERKITRPVHEMVQATKAIASGDLSLRVTSSSSDEFGELAESFNKMADALSLTLDKLEEYSHRLEEKVYQRTKELEANTRALQKANAELEKLDGLKTDFISNVSHELRTPLTSIKAVAEILARQDQELPREKTLEFLNIIESQTDRLTRLIGEILDLSHIEHEGSTSAPQAIRLHDVISEAIGSVRGIASERGVTIAADVPEDLPSAAAERDKAIQVLINLLGNALKHTPEGCSITVSARLLEEEQIWRNSPRPVSGIAVSVADTGPGIPLEQLGAIFDKFKQIKSAAWGKPVGSGLGLSISREIVDRFGGTIWAESVPGAGSVFHFTMDVAEEALVQVA
jgi:signal transduction histidine kinase